MFSAGQRCAVWSDRVQRHQIFKGDAFLWTKPITGWMDLAWLGLQGSAPSPVEGRNIPLASCGCFGRCFGVRSHESPMSGGLGLGWRGCDAPGPLSPVACVCVWEALLPWRSCGNCLPGLPDFFPSTKQMHLSSCKELAASSSGVTQTCKCLE